MGPISPYGPKQFGRLTEQDIFNQSQKFMAQQQLCDKNDDIFLTIRRLIADINIYGQRHLLDHLRNTPDKAKKVQFLMHWRTLQLQNLDILFQNLIRKKILRIDQEQHFSKVPLTHKYTHPQGRKLYQNGEQLLRQKKVAIILFLGSNSGRGQEGFIKQFHNGKSTTDTCLFDILMQRLRQIGEKYGCPSTYIFHNANVQTKITDFLKNLPFASDIQFCLQNTHPILNLNGNLCLKAKDQPDIIEIPSGSADFFTASFNGQNILDRMKREGIEYVTCVESGNLLQMIVDPFLVGLAAEGGKEVFYKCTHSLDPKQKLLRRVVVQNGIPRADTQQTLNSFINYNHKYRGNNNENVQSSPVWMGHLVFLLSPVAALLQGPDSPPTFPQAVNYISKNMNFWSPIDRHMHVQQSCYVFERQISDLLINNLFKSTAVFVEREEECVYVLTQKKEHNWEIGYNQYINRKNKPIKLFYERYEEQLAVKEKERLQKQARDKSQQQLKQKEEKQIKAEIEQNLKPPVE